MDKSSSPGQPENTTGQPKLEEWLLSGQLYFSGSGIVLVICSAYVKFSGFFANCSIPLYKTHHGMLVLRHKLKYMICYMIYYDTIFYLKNVNLLGKVVS